MCIRDSFSGAPEENIVLSDKICVQAKNDRITLALHSTDTDKLEDAKEYNLVAMGTTGTDETTYEKGTEMMGVTFTAVTFKGKLFAETLEGRVCVKAEQATLQILNPIGEVLSEMEGERTEDGVCFEIDGKIPGVQYHLILR